MVMYSFCESVYQGPLSKWHIRKLTDKGRKLGGGADTLSLCEKQVHWDLQVEITEFHLNNSACKNCLEKYKTGVKEEKYGKENGKY